MTTPFRIVYCLMQDITLLFQQTGNTARLSICFNIICSMSTTGGAKLTHWLAIGTPDNWSFCFEHGNVWGFPRRYERAWSSISDDDILICYATSPIKGVIGYCKITARRKAQTPLFPQEIKTGRVLWPLRVTLAAGNMIPQHLWPAERIAYVNRNPQAALQRVIEVNGKRIITELDQPLP